MPVYDYACSACGHRIEVIHGRDEPGPIACAACGGSMRKLMSAAAIVFRGSGWAKRDRAVTTSPSSAKGDGEGSGTGSSDRDPARGGAGSDRDSGTGDGAAPARGDTTKTPATTSTETKGQKTSGTEAGRDSKQRQEGRPGPRGSAPAPGGGSD
ncbi:MAG: zinc ribbon domain-containing protein [Chloroflexi bacterium]|nr:zinc ribbon domain-containing protein [Chloroflexota bacterium]